MERDLWARSRVLGDHAPPFQTSAFISMRFAPEITARQVGKLLAAAGCDAYVPQSQAECIGRSLVRQGEESPDSAGQDVPWLTREPRC